MARIDLRATIERVDFPEAIWDWLDLLGDMVAAIQAEGLKREGGTTVVADDPFRRLLIAGFNRMDRILGAIYILLRCEYIDLAASQVRILCETLITLTFVSRDRAALAPRFWSYYTIEAFETAAAMVELEQHRARPEHVRSMQAWLETQRADYERLKPTYMQMVLRGRNKGKTKPYINWCNRTLAQQAHDCGSELERLYRLVYRQMSSYVHCSAFSLRHQLAYSRAHYDGKVVHIDVIAIVRTTGAVWVEICKFLAEQLGWDLIGPAQAMSKAIEDLEQAQFNARLA